MDVLEQAQLDKFRIWFDDYVVGFYGGADKLGAYYVVMKYYEQYRDNPQNFKLGVELPDEPGYSAHVVNEPLCGQCADNKQLRILNDLKLSLLGWVHDVNFTSTLE